MNTLTTDESIAKKQCMSCDSRPIDEKFTKEILFETCTFCSGWCLRDYEYDVRKGWRGSFHKGYEKRQNEKRKKESRK